jgi:hypothetical protein
MGHASPNERTLRMALFGAFPEPHTLAQFARRVGISEGRARALYNEGKLPRPDQFDAGRRPLWSPTTIDAWCKQTGRSLGEKVAWLHRAQPAGEPAPVLLHSIIEHKPTYATVKLHVIIWDTPHGHLVYLTPVYEGDSGGEHPDAIAAVAADLIRPAFWPQALIVQPITGGIGSELITPTVHLNLHRLETELAESASAEPGSWFRRRKAHSPQQSGRVRARFSGMVEAKDVAAVIGAPVPLWIEGTCTSAAVKRAQAYNSTFTVPDTVTDWPPARDQILAAFNTEMPDKFPAAFAALAAQAHDTYQQVQALQTRQRDEGDGWCLVARPAPPDIPFAAEVAITTARPSSDMDAVALELTELRSMEASLAADAPEGDAYETAVKLLTWQLHQGQPSAATGRIDVYSDHYGGPVTDQWRQTLQPVPEAVLKSRRVRRLVSGWEASQIIEVLRGHGDMHVAVLENGHGGRYFHAEWPYDLPHGWNDRTIIAADPGGAIFALTPTGSGDMNVDPVPLDPGTGPSLAYGYDGGSPYGLYQALIRCVFRTPEAPFSLNDVDDGSGPNPANTELWHAIATTEGPLRLPWPTVQEWARADAAKAGYTGTTA